MLTTLAAISPGWPALASLSVYLVLIAAAAYAGGSSVAFLSLGHRRMQVLLSFTGGVMLGVGLLHLLPHAYLELSHQIEPTTAWVLAGFFLMFLLERAFHGHAHHTADGSHAGHGHDHGHGHACGHDHAAGHQHDHRHDAAEGSRRSGPWAWSGAFAGLALHSLADGEHGVGLLAGFATFLAVVLHKPFDAGIIATLMINAGARARTRRIFNLLYALIVPLGAALFLGSLRLFGGDHGTVLGVALAMAAGAFLCIAAADLLPEVEFHSHDRLLLTASLTLGITIAWGITVMERASHAHAVHGGDAVHSRREAAAE